MSFIFLRSKRLMKKKIVSLCLCLKTKIHEIFKKRRHSKQTLWHIKRRCLWGGRLWWALNTSLTNYNLFRDRRCRSLAFNEIENWCESHATMTGSYCEAALINGATTEERSCTIKSKIKKRSNSWKVGTARGRWTAPRFASPVVKKFGRSTISS